MLLEHGIQVFMDGNGRYTDPDNIGLARLWRSINYEEVYLKAYQNWSEAGRGLVLINISTIGNGLIRL